MKFWRGGARGDWSLVFKNRREFAGVPTCPPNVPPPHPVPIAPQICTRVTSLACIYARAPAPAIYYTYNSLTEICENARTGKTHARGWGSKERPRGMLVGEYNIDECVGDIDSWSISVLPRQIPGEGVERRARARAKGGERARERSESIHPLSRQRRARMTKRPGQWQNGSPHRGDSARKSAGIFRSPDRSIMEPKLRAPPPSRARERRLHICTSPLTHAPRTHACVRVVHESIGSRRVREREAR